MKSSTLFIITFILFITDLNRSYSQIETNKIVNSTYISNLLTDNLNITTETFPDKIVKVVSIKKVSDGLTIKSDEHLSNESSVAKEISNIQQQNLNNKQSGKELKKTGSNSTKKIDECSKFKIDYLVLSLYWPVNICSKKACILNSPQRWFIYHLSPGSLQMQNSQFIIQCCSKRPFNLSELGLVTTNDLKNYMQSVLATKPDEVFWNEEWLNVGSCLRSHEKLGTLHSYFSETVRLYKETNIEDWLKEKDIVPQNDTSKVYKFDSFYSAIYDKRQYKFQIKCNPLLSKHSNVSIIEKVNFCLDKNLNKINCPSTQSLKSNCNDLILYPSLEADIAEKKI